MNIRFENLTKDNYKDLHKIDLECFRDEVWEENTFFSDLADSFKTYEIAYNLHCRSLSFLVLVFFLIYNQKLLYGKKYYVLV